MCHGAPVLVDYKDNRQTGVQQFSLALRGRLLHGIENFLKRDNRDHGRNHVLIICATQYGFSDRECHFLSGTNDLRPADNQATSIHAREHFAHSRIHFLEFDHFRLESTMKRAIDRPESECDQVRDLPGVSPGDVDRSRNCPMP